MPARRKRLNIIKKRRISKIDKKHRKIGLFGVFVAISLMILLSFSYFKFSKVNMWDSGNFLAVVSKGEADDINVMVFDPVISKIVTISIPGDTQVDVSRGLGVLRVKNVWQLGINEGLRGKLMAETVTRNFKLPLNSWTEYPLIDVLDGNLKNALYFLLFPGNTNLNFADRVHLVHFAINVKDFKKDKIELEKTTMIERSEINDGGVGYRLSGRYPESVLFLVSDKLFSESPSVFSIIDATGTSNTASDFARVIESLGPKVTYIKEIEENETDCIVRSKKAAVGERISKLFGCTNAKDNLEGSFDFEIMIGKAFSKRF